ncbi:MAG: TIGR02996 domain-containing protein [Deltaproteobacteria bacterium]|nr:TIGR02996 domain-containing protein [Deltaproteobacteria bacterium]
MIRLERDDEIWQVRRDGTILEVKSGRTGAKARTERKYHANVESAEAALAELVCAKREAGYTEAGARERPAATGIAPLDDPQAVALRAAIARDPYDASAYAVYGDWLQGHGDPRGELIALQLAAEAITKPGDRRERALRAVGRYLEKHAAHLLGDLASEVSEIREPHFAPFYWRSGFVHRASLYAVDDAAEVLARLLAHPSGALLAELDIRAGETHANRAIEVLARAAPPSLRVVSLRARGAVGNLDRLWPALAPVRDLAIGARSFEVGVIALPALRKLSLQTVQLSRATVAAIAAAPWPALERLELRLCSRWESSPVELGDLAALVGRTALPVLTALEIRGARFAGALVHVLAASPLAPRLEVLDLMAGRIAADDLVALAAARPAFPALREVWLPIDELTPALQAILERTYGKVIREDAFSMDTFDLDVGAG